MLVERVVFLSGSSCLSVRRRHGHTSLSSLPSRMAEDGKGSMTCPMPCIGSIDIVVVLIDAVASPNHVLVVGASVKMPKRG